jgi:hypothetical protein
MFQSIKETTLLMKRKGDILIVFSLYKLLKFTYIKSVNFYFHGRLPKSREIISINKRKIC